MEMQLLTSTRQVLSVQMIKIMTPKMDLSIHKSTFFLVDVYPNDLPQSQTQWPATGSTPVGFCMDTCAVWWSQHGHPHHKSVLSWLLGLGVTRNGAFDTPKYGKSNGESDVSIHFQPLGVPSVRLSPILGEIDILRLNIPGQQLSPRPYTVRPSRQRGR